MILLKVSGFLLWAPVEAALLASTGFTPGKLLFRIEIRRNGLKLDFPNALRRAALVTVLGLACGVPVIQGIAMAAGLAQLYTGGAYWDRSTGSDVVCRELGAARSVAATLVMLFVLGAHVRDVQWILEDLWPWAKMTLL